MDKKIDEAVSAAEVNRSLPATEVSPPGRAKRRHFGLAHKARILALVDACGPGEQGHIIRREGVYASHLSRWRKEVERDARAGAHKRGPKRRAYKDLMNEIKRLKKQATSFERKVAKYELIIDVQKKMALLLNSPLEDEAQGEENS